MTYDNKNLIDAGREIEGLIMQSASDERGTNAERALRVAAGLTGLCLLLSCIPGEQIESLEPNTPLLVESVSRQTQEVLGGFLEGAAKLGIDPRLESGWLLMPPQGYEDDEPLGELLAKVRGPVRKILEKRSLAWIDGCRLICGLTVKILAGTEKILPPGLGKALITDSFMRAAKTVPYSDSQAQGL
jgi:hypothetical protein